MTENNYRDDKELERIVKSVADILNPDAFSPSRADGNNDEVRAYETADEIVDYILDELHDLGYEAKEWIQNREDFSARNPDNS